MDKAILVINMPKTCSECNFFTDSFDYPTCMVTNESQGYKFNKYQSKMNCCPLKKLPDKKEDYLDYLETDVCQQMYAGGWDDCIDEILE